jgi:hypothetical protein
MLLLAYHGISTKGRERYANLTTSLYGNTCRFRLYPVPTVLYTNLSIIPERQMSQHDNEALAHRFHMDIFQKGELRVAD